MAIAPQPRLILSESDRLYAAVMTLRKAGARVYRHGGRHKVDGKIIENAELVVLARTTGSPQA
ncbi:MAG: hypothetical protein HQL39_20615 [Alphaproteobacteria bacterium]|nr:hypothetical protein [Alphaproteobacteria bacterium]